MNKILILLFSAIFFNSCSNIEDTDKYKNADKYTVNIGDTIEIYYTSNTCCYHCFSNKEDTKHSKLIGEKTITEPSKKYVGSNHIEAFIFKAESIGVDTIKLKDLTATEDCDSSEVQPEIYVIEVK